MGIRIEKSWYFFGSPIVIYPCPNCDHELKSPVSDIGTDDACPECNDSYVVPGATEFQIYIDLRAKKTTKGNNPENTLQSSAVFYKALILKTRPFNFDREVDDRIRYYSRFRYFAPVLNQNPKIVLGVSGNTCPYCENKLQKKKCANCGKSHRTRSSVQDYKVTVNIREEWVQPIDEQRAKRDGWHKSYLEGVRLRAAINDVLVAMGKTEDLDQTTEYLALENEKKALVKDKQWGSYASVVFEQALILDKQGKTKEALAKYIEEVYLDMNGATNSHLGGEKPTPLTRQEIRDMKLSRQDVRLFNGDLDEWDEDLSSMTHADEIFVQSEALGLSRKQIKEIFVEIATETKQRFGCPLKPLTAFNMVWKESNSSPDVDE